MMAADKEIATSNGTRRIYNLRARKSVSITAPPQDQHAAKSSNTGKRKAAEISTDDTIPAQKACKLTFFDLPPELRNDIYIRVLRSPIENPKPRRLRLGKLNPKWLNQNLNKAQKLEMRRFDRTRNEIKAAVEPIGKFGDHKHHGSGFYAPYSTYETYDVFESAYPNTLLHKEPALWQVSRRVRQECRSLYISKYCSIDVRGMHRPASWLPHLKINQGLKHFEHWFAHDLNEQDRVSITHLELWDQVKVVFPAQKAGWLDDAWYLVKPAFHLQILDSGKIFRAITPFELDSDEAAALQAFFNQLAQDKTSGSESSTFTGEDIAACVRFLRSICCFSDGWPAPGPREYPYFFDRRDTNLRFKVENGWVPMRCHMNLKPGEDPSPLDIHQMIEEVYSQPFKHVAASVQPPFTGSD